MSRPMRTVLISTALVDGWSLDAPVVERRPGGCNGLVWDVRSGGHRYVAKLAQPTASFLGGLQAAAALSARGMRSGRPVPSRDGALSHPLGEGELALLDHVPGRSLLVERPAEARLWGSTLARAHTSLESAAPAVESWPWPWMCGEAPHLGHQSWIRPAVARAVERALLFAHRSPTPQTVLHGDPSPKEFLLDETAGGPHVVGLVDWGSAVRGPALYDIASLAFFAPNRAALTAAVGSYTHRRHLPSLDREGLQCFTQLRWAAQAWYFSWRLAYGVTTGGDRRFSERSLSEARIALANV